jgi:hypothetical protein
MPVEDLSLLKFGVINFFAILMNRPIVTPSQSLLCEITHSIIEAETEPDKVIKERVKKIYERTNEKLNVSLATVETVVFKNMNKGLSTEIDFETKGGGRTKVFTIAELIHILSDIRWELVTIVTKIVKKYTMEMPLYDVSGGMRTSFNLAGSLQETSKPIPS